MLFATRLFDGRDGSRTLAELSFSFLVAETPTTGPNRRNRLRRLPKRENMEEQSRLNEMLLQVVYQNGYAQAMF